MKKRIEWRRTAGYLTTLLTIVLLGELFAVFVVERHRGLESPTKDIQVERQIDFIDGFADGAGIVVAGTSMAGVGVDPVVLTRETGVVTFNASLGCGNPLVMEDWLLNFVAPELDPGVVVLSVAPTDLDRDACPREWTEIEMLVTPSNGRQIDVRAYLRENSALWRNRDWLRGINNLPLLVFGNDWVWDVTFRPDGFWVVDDYAPVDKDVFLLNPNRTQIRAEAPYANALERTIEELSTTGVHVVVAEVPMAQRWIDHLAGSNRSYTEAQDYLREIAEENGASFIGTTQDLHDNEGFIDEGHMTPEAAAVYSKYLSDALTEIQATN